VLTAAVDELRRLAGRRVRATFSRDVAAPPDWPAGCDVELATPRLWDLRVTGPLGPVVTMLAGRPLTDLDVQVPPLEAVLRKYYAKQAPS
jgi:hypothetical protein